MCYGDKVLCLIRPIVNFKNARPCKLAKFLINNLPTGPATRHSIHLVHTHVPFGKASEPMPSFHSYRRDKTSFFLESFHVATATVHPLRLPQTGAKYSQRQRNLRCEFCRGLELTRRQVAVPTLARKNRAGVCETAAIYSLSLLAWFFLSLSPR